MTVKKIRPFIVVSLFLLFVAVIPASAQAVLPQTFAGWTAGTTIVPTIEFKDPTTEAVSREYGIVSIEKADS